MSKEICHPATAQSVAALYRDFVQRPESVDSAWRNVFAVLDDDARLWLQGMTPDDASDVRSATLDSVRALMFIRTYRVRGHLIADLDPLKLTPRTPSPELEPAAYGFSEADLDRPIFIHGVLGFETASMREITAAVRRHYCGNIGWEFMHIQDPAQKAFVQNYVENELPAAHFTDTEKVAILDRLAAAEALERFLDRKYKGTKRFGLDGGESAVVALETILVHASRRGVEEIVIGMSHRGRLNVLANVMKKPARAIFSEFRGGSEKPEQVGGSGDVKYHLGTSADRIIEGRNLHLSLTPNPSHLEAVDPIVVGKVRARQDQRGDSERTRVMGLLMHGDAAFAGQGLVPETLQFCELPGYRCGGVLHLIVNNQIGFTTSPLMARSSPYCSDVAKMIQAPIVHVNGDEPEMVARAAEFAVAFRQTFKKDVIIDMYCYRRHGHNEGDEPAFTQPRMYREIRSHETTRSIYAKKLLDGGNLDVTAWQQINDNLSNILNAEFDAAADYRPEQADWLGGSWSGLEPVRGYDARRGETEVAGEILREIGATITDVPDGFNVHPKIARILEQKKAMAASGEGVDWATAEALAFGSLLLEGHPVRLSGEDSNRGTFSHRHISWIDQETEARYVALNHIRPHQERIDILDSPLSEFGVLGFEYGYASADPRTLVAWEAQFGDFANGAQVIIDQFLAAGEAKWLRMNGLVLLLPHGHEGQGPEHSSARLERFLQLCAEDNIQVVSCTTPANYFHVLRRQMHRPFRKPLVVMAPKSLLRHKGCVSPLSMMGPGSSFHRVLHCDGLPGNPADARQVVLCTGKIYYDLVEERQRRGIGDVHFLRMEQLYPFPADALAEALLPYRHCHLVWCQEEPRNMGAWSFASEFVAEVAEGVGCVRPQARYAGRPTSAAPATGHHRRHVDEQKRLVDEALTVGLRASRRIAAKKEPVLV